MAILANNFLRPEALIRCEEGVPFLTRAGSRVSHRLSIAEGVALTLLAASGDAEATIDELSGFLPEGSARATMARVQERYPTYLGADAPRDLDFTWFDTVDPAKAPLLRSEREAAPAAVIWLVTLRCNRRCPYCFYGAPKRSRSESAAAAAVELPEQRGIALIEEMADVGVADLYFTGGEPLLCDLTGHIAAASRLGIRTHLSTKYPVGRALARGLASSRLHQVTYSLDDGRPRQAAALSGSPGFLTAAIDAITALREEGLSVSINAVATAINIDALEPLARLAIALGVHRLIVSTFREPFPLHQRSRNLRIADANVVETVARLRDRYGAHLVIELEGARHNGARPEPETRICTSGYRDLHLLPDGRVTVCRYQPDCDALIVGSLADQSILDVWSSTRFSAFHSPSRSDYQGLACAKCVTFADCSRRGRCFASSWARHLRVHAPDDFCQRPALS